MRPHARQRILVVTLLALTLSYSVFTGPRAQSAHIEVPAITLSTIQGFSATISDYSSDGNSFTFTLTNNSPLALTAIGADLGPRIPVRILSQTGPNPPFHVAAFIPGSGVFDNKIAGVQMSFVLASSALGPGQSTTISLNLIGDAEFIASRFFVSFFPELQFNCSPPFDNDGPLLIQFTRIEPTQLCLVFTNLGSEVMTGIAFDFEDDRGIFEVLSITPSRQPFKQHFRFSKIAEPLPGFSGRSDFGILTGGRFAVGANQIGVQPGESTSEFCVAGNFAGLMPEAILQSTYVRANKLTRQCIIQGPPVGGGQTGLLAGALR